MIRAHKPLIYLLIHESVMGQPFVQGQWQIHSLKEGFQNSSVCFGFCVKIHMNPFKYIIII